MKQHLMHLAAALSGAAGLLITTASPAWATATVGSSGGSATYDSPSNKMSISDTNCDGRYQYTLHNWGTSTSSATATRLENHGGCNSTLVVGLSPGSNTQITFRTCTEIPNGPDSCSSWVTTPA